LENTGLTGAAGELLVAAELLRRGIAVARPLYDQGIDLLAFHVDDPTRTVPIQVKARSGSGYNFQKEWFRVETMILVLVWHSATTPEFYVFKRADVDKALGPIHSSSPSWLEKGVYSVTEPGLEIIGRMKDHKDKWERITEALGELKLSKTVSAPSL
jgi:hypothetical protein